MKPTTNQKGTNPKGADYWTKRISDEEMPALCSTVRDLEKLAKDDVSSLAILGRSVMHDNALTSRILRVANSAIYNKGINHVSTVSRAAVVLGFDTIRNICITAKLLANLLESHHLSESVYKRLLELIAQSFQAAMLARMMMDDRDESLREEVFIASLLYRVGESAFWSMGGEITEQLDKQLSSTEDQVKQNSLIRSELGTSFTQLTQSIARSWGLGDVLVKSLTQPNERMPEIQSIFLANKLSEIVSHPVINNEELQLRLTQAAKMLDISVAEFTEKFIECGNITHKLAIEYGAKAILSYLPNTTELLTHAEPLIKPVLIRQSNQGYQLTKLRQLTQYVVEKTDFNQIIHTTLEGILTGVGVDRCGVLLLSPNRKQLQSRVMIGDDIELLKQAFVIELNHPQSVFTQCVEQKKSIWVNAPTKAECKVQMNDTLVERLPCNGFLLAPLAVGTKVLGVFYADRDGSDRVFEQQDFDSFTHFSELANVCFGMSMT